MTRSRQKLLLLAVLLVVLVFGVTASVSAAPGRDYKIHIVGPGETLIFLAARYGTSVGAIAAANGLGNTNFIWIGQKLVIPSDYVPAPGATTRYVIRPGDTLSRIALNYGTTIAAIQGVNGISDPSHIYVGEILVVPVAAPVPAPIPVPAHGPAPLPNTYVVRPGDSLGFIALRYGTSVTAIQLANGIAYPSLIYPGQVLLMPGLYAPPPAPLPRPPSGPPPGPPPVYHHYDHEPAPTATPVPAPVLSPAVCSDNVNITFPRQNEVVDGVGTIFIQGTASIPNFQFYKLEYGVGDYPISVNSISSDVFRQQIADGILASWNTGALPNGTYTLRLTVVDTKGQFPTPCNVKVTISH
ncbi:MAG: LysM peptidoglycan-binding domain-containing protein [Chloroflexi bacterium]|nr:LysM peptidoglycan-binding domain-containing protein [Chloroflexota bacterium]